MKNRLSTRFASFDSSDFRDIIEKKQSLTNPIDLSVGEPEDNTHDLIKAAGIKAIQNNHTKYVAANGVQELRRAIRLKLDNENNLQHHHDDISIVPGLTTGLLITYMAILDPGDEIIIMDPCYPPYTQLANVLGASVVSVKTLGNFQLDIREIELAVTPKTKAIVINSPNNPTGTVYPEKDLRKVAEIAKSNNLYVISDEIYEHFVYDDKHFSIGSCHPDTISMFGFSKQYSMTGWRLGYISGPTDVIDAINELQQYAIFSSSSIAQHAALEALNLEQTLVSKYKKKRDFVVNKLTDLGIDVAGAQGAYYVFFKAPGNLDDVQFIEKLLEHNLVMLPGRAFSDSNRFVRLSYGPRFDEVQKGMKVISKVLSVIK